MAFSKWTFRFFAAVTVFLNFAACSPVHETASPSGSSINGLSSELTPSESAFSNSLYFELKTNCATCHGDKDPYIPISDNVSQTHKMVLDLGFANLEAPATSSLVSLIGGGHQGLQATLGTTLQNAIQSWANQVNVLADTNPDPNSQDTVSLAALRATTFTPKCSGCHGGNSPAAGLDFSNFADIQARVNIGNAMASTLYQRITSNDPNVRMPRGGDALPQAEIDAILLWIQQGAQDN